jgi:hypothetical protein
MCVITQLFDRPSALAEIDIRGLTEDIGDDQLLDLSGSPNR